MTISTKHYVSVNVGTIANDGTGDDLRTAFTKVNQNFANYETVGFPTGNISSAGTVQAAYFIGDGSQLTGVTLASGNLSSSGTVVNTGYQISKPTANTAITASALTSRLVLAPTNTIVGIFGANVTLPSANVDGTIFSITSNVATVLSVMPNTGTTLTPFGNVTLTAGTAASYLYYAADTKWYKIG